MEPFNRDPARFETLSLFRQIAQQEGYRLSDAVSGQKFVTRISAELDEARSNPALLHGVRAEVMFEYIASSLGRCALIKAEDSGGIRSKEKLIVPDFRIVLESGDDFLVEVKNFRQRQSRSSQKFKKKYLDGLKRYAEIVRSDIKIATYWVLWRKWTLVPIEKISRVGDHYDLTFIDAMKYNEMGSLGDFMIGTIPPLEFRIVADRGSLRTIGADGLVNFTIGGVDLYSGEELIEDPQEKTFAFYLLLYGQWPVEDGLVETDGDQLVSIRYIAEPIERDSNHQFQTIGFMSSMMAQRFNEITIADGKVERLSPTSPSENLGFRVPKGYRGKNLHLWAFYISPMEGEARSEKLG